MADKLNKSGILNAAGPFPTGFKILNNITSGDLKNSYPTPLVQRNFAPKTTADFTQYFTNSNIQDYTLANQSPCIDTCELAPFNDQIINKPDGGCLESGIPAWKAGYGNLKKQFLISDANFSLKTGYQTPKEWKFPVYVLPYCGFAGDVNLSVADLPKGIKVSLWKILCLRA